MSEPLIRLLTLCLLALVYLFFFRVLRAVWVEVRPPRPPGSRRRRAPRTAANGPTELVIVEPVAQQGRSYPMADELTVGRAAGCAVVLDDTYASQLHARVFRRDGHLMIEDLGSTNGTYLNRQRVTGPAVVRPGDLVQIGASVFEAR